MKSTKRALKAVALAAVLTAVMLLSSGCIAIPIGSITLGAPGALDVQVAAPAAPVFSELMK